MLDVAILTRYLAELNMERNTIYVVRHGESMGNIERKLLSAQDDVLSQEGVKQAKLLGEHLSAIKFTKAFTSDFPRALQTAKGILSESQHEVPTLNTDIRIRERSYGELEGMDYKEGFRRYQLVKKETGISSIFEFNFKGETVQEVGQRMFEFLKELCDSLDKSDKPETVLIVSHSFALITLMKHLTSPNDSFHLSNWTSEDFKMMKNGTYMEIHVEKKSEGTERSPRDLFFHSKHVNVHLTGTKVKSGMTEQGALSKFVEVTEDAKEFIGCVQQ